MAGTEVTGIDIKICRKCGLCCWNWKERNIMDKCEHLHKDLKTCIVYKDLKKIRPECYKFPTIEQASDLPLNCGYVLRWKLLRLL